MNRFLLLAIACVLGAAACTRLREPTDVQLGALLRSERASPTDANALLDANAVECLRAWSGDAELAKNLPVRTTSDDGKAACKGKLDGWLVDAARNPDKFRFEEVSAPKVARRAMELQIARQAAALANSGSQQIPAALTKRNVVPPTFRTTDPSIDLGSAGPLIKEAETLCQQANQAAASQGANPRLVSFAKYCSGSLRTMRASMEGFAKNGNKKGLDSLAESATGMANAARNVLALPPAQ